MRKAGNRGEQGMSKVRRHPQSRRGRAWGRDAMEAKVPGEAKAVTEGALGEGDFWIQSGMRGQQPLRQLPGEPGLREGQSPERGDGWRQEFSPCVPRHGRAGSRSLAGSPHLQPRAGEHCGTGRGRERGQARGGHGLTPEKEARGQTH